MNRAQKVLGIYELSTGGVNGTVADPKLDFIVALKNNSCNTILSNNHSSGNLKPSKADEDFTNKIKQAGILLDINVLDHTIITSGGYYSVADEGMF